MSEKPTSITIDYWVKRGIMKVNAYALDADDPDHPYNQALRQGADPADFGIEHPLNKEFESKTRGELIAEIIKLRKELYSREKWSAVL